MKAHNQLFDVSDAYADFWADFEEDHILINEDNNKISIKDEVELEA